MPINSKVKKLYDALKADGGDVGTPEEFNSWFFKPGKEGYKNRKSVYDTFKTDGADVGKNYEEFGKWLGLHAVYPTVNKYRQQMFSSVDPNRSRASELTHRAVGQAVRATNNVRKPVVAKVVNRKGKPTGEKFAITPAKTVEDLDREYAQETTKNWENELHDQMADADKDAAKISDMFKSFIGSTDEVGSVWGNMTRGGGIAGTPHSVTTNNGILENTEARQILAAGDYNRKRRELLQLEQDSRLSKDTSLLGGVKKAYNDIKNGEFSKAGKDLVYGAGFDNHSFFRGMYDAAKDTGFLTGGASDLINAGSLLATKQDLNNGVHTEAGDMLMQQAVKNSDAQSQYGDNQGWMYTGGIITTNMAPFITQIASAGFSKGMSNAIGKVVQGAASKVALGTMEKATGMAGAHIANYIGKVTGLTTKAFGKAIQYGIVGAAQANTVGLGNVANDVVSRYTGQVYQDEHGNYKFGTFDSEGKLVHEGGEDFLTSLVKGEAAQTIEFATELAGGGIDAAGTALKNFVTKGGKKIINKYNMENVSKVIDFLLNNKVSKHARYLKAGADRTLGKVELNSIVGESLEEELGIIANTVFTGDNKISDLWDEKQQSQIWGGMLLSIGLMKGVVAPFHAYNAKQYYSYKHKLDKADVNLSQLLGKEKWEELRNQIDATTNDDMPEMVNKINRDVALGKNRQPVREYIQNLLIMRGYDIGNMLAAKKAVEDKGKGVSVKNMEKNQAYQQGRDAYGYDTHEIQLDQADKQKTLAQLLGITEQQLSTMSDEELDNLSGRDDNLDKAIYDYQLSTIRYQGVADNAQDQVDLAAQKAAQAVDMYTDKSRNTIRNATIKATGGLEDYGVYIINGNIATHDDGSIDVGNSDDMILFYDPTTNTVEHADATRFAELGSEENADEVRNQAVADAKENAIKEITGIIDGVVEVGTQFKAIDADGTEHTYEVLSDNGDGTAMITIDGNIPTQLVKGENVNVPVSFEELQKMKDESDQQRLQAAKAQREQMEKERAEQQMQAQTTQAENPAQESNTQSAPIEDNLKYSDILRKDGKVQMVDVSDKDGNNLFPDAKDVFYIQGNKMRTKFAYIDANGELKTQSFPTGLVKIKTRGEVSVDDYKKYRSMILSAESSAMPESSMIEENSGSIEADRGGIEVEDNTQPLSEADADNVIAQMESSAETAPELELTPDNWTAEFGEDGIVSTPIGEVKMGENQVAKLFEKGRSKEFGMIKPTLTNPDVIIEVPSHSADGNEERSSSYLFIKTFLGKNGEKVYYFKSVTIKKDGLEISISSHYDRAKRVKEALMKGKLLYRKNDGAQTEQNQPSTSVTTSQEDAAGSSESKDTNISANGNENNESLTFEDGTPIPVDVNGEVDLSQTDAAHAAEWYDTNLGEDADGWLDGEINKAKKVLEQAKNKKLTGTKPSELVASKKEKEAAIADAQAHYDSAISIRDSLKERRIAKEENTADGRKNLIEKARRKFSRLKSAVKDDAEAVSQLYKDVVGSLLHRLYDGTGIDVTDTIPLTAEEYVASNLGAHSLNYEGTETSKGVKQETGLSREDFAKTQLLAADGKGTTIDDLVHSLWENRPSNLESLDTQDIRNALIGVLNSGFKASEARNYIENLRIAQAENILEEQKKAADNAAFAEENKAESEQQTETAPESEEKAGEDNSDEINDEENEQTNENTNAPEQTKFPDKLREGSKAIEVPEDATEENPLGLQLSEDKVPFEIEGRKSGETYNINDNEDRQRLINDNKVDDKDILDIDMPKHVHKAIKELCKKMGLKVQFLYMGAKSNGWIENGTMYLALDTEKATQFVFGHEMTHAIKQKNPEAYKELVKVAMAVTTRKKFEEDLAKVYQNYHGISGYNNIDDYVEEVVADNLGKFINDFDLAQKFSLRLNHPILATILHAIQKIKSLLYGDFYKSVDALERIVEKAYVKTANGEVTNSETGEEVSFSLRQKPEPKKKGIGYKVFVLKDGKLYPPMVANPDGAATPVGVWLDADAAPIAGESKTGRPQVKQGGKGTQGGSGKLAYRPGWHLGVVPYAIQFNRKDAEGNKTLFPKNFVFAEVEYAADVDYQEEARQEGVNPSGKYQHSLAGLKHLPTDGFYMYRTNPNPETDPWVITGAMKVNRILTRAEQAELVKNAGREPQQIQEGDIVTDDVVNSINQEIADAPKFSLKSKPVRFEAGKKLSDEEKKEVLSTLKDAYKVNGVPYHIEETAGGKEKRVYEPTADSYVVSDITNRPLRYYITLPDGRVAHPTEVYPNISDNEVKSSATKQGLLDEEVDQIVSAAIGNMKDIADNAKAVEVLTELQNLPHETHDVGYGLNHARSYNYKTGIFTSDAAQAIDYVVRRMRRKEDVPAEIPAALKKAVADSYGMVDNLIDGMSNTKVGAAEIKPVGVGAFGNIYNQFRGKAKAAIEFLKKLGSGEAAAALHHHTIGDISLVWGDKKTGLDKILRKHPEVVDNLQSIIDSMEVVQESDNRIKLESPTHFAVVSKEYKGEPREQWLLTAYEKRESLENGKSMDTATSSLGGDTALSQSKESAAKIDNSSETSKENGEKFSLKDEKTMFGMHNISIDKLRKAIKQGGFAAPSMGVVDSKNGIYSDYGEITLIPKAEKLAKRTGKNAGTFTADAWTPTYPQVERIMNKQGEKVFNTDMNEKLGDVDNGIYSNIRESWKGYLSSGDVRDGLYWHYLFDKGMNPETIYQTGKYDNDITNEVMRISDNGNKTDYTDEEVAELIQLKNKVTGEDNDVEAMREKLKARIASAEKKGNHLLVALKKKRLAELEGVENFYVAADFVNDVVRNNRKNGKVDVHDTMSVAKEKVENDKKLSADFPSWLDKKTEEYGVEEMLYNGTTPSGKPKYIPNTIDNAVKLMKKQGVAGGYTAFGSELGVFIAKNSPEVNTLAAMKNAKDKLIPFGDERHNQIKDKITKEFLELSDEIRVGSNNRYAFDDSGVSRMVELTDHKGNEKEYLKKAYNVEVSDEWMDRYNKLLDTIKKDYKVFYFETKFMRPYGLDEFEKAIVPSDTPSDVVDALKKAGIDVSSYERGNAEDRQKVTMDAINSSDNIRFSLAGERGAAAADKAEERTFRMDNLSVARKMEEEKKDAKAIKMATGWERGADGKWRYEMPDAKIKDTMDVGGGHIVKRYEDDMLWNGGKLSDVIDAPELFKAYPHLKDVRIETDAIMNDMPSNGEYNAKTNTITIHADELKYMNSILNHEIQHAIQSIEGFDRGGSPRLVRGEIKKRLAEVTKQIRQLRAEGKEDEAKAIVEKNRGLYNAYQANDDYNSYKSLAGEVEARNVQERMNMSPEERRRTLAESTEDVARKDQIFLGVGDVSFSLRGSTPYDKQMEEWMEKNHLEKGAVPMEKPIMKEGENIFDYANRMVEWTRNQNLWKTAPKKTGFQDALDKWKADNGLSPDAYPPVRPHRENYSTEIGYTEDLEEYNKKKEIWKSAPKPKDFDLSVDLENMNKQLRNIRRAVLNQKNYDQRTVKAVSDLVRKMLNIGWGDGLSRGKVGNLLSAAKNATGANDVKKYLDKAMGILAENYLNRLSTAYDNLINTKGARADQSGVIKMGSLDAKGQAFMSEYKKAINMDDSSLNTYIANIEEDSAKNEDNVEMNDYRLAGIQAAIMYKQQIGGNDADIAELKRQIGELKNKKDATKEDKDLLKSLEKKLFENKFDRITMFENLLNNIQRMVKESKGRAKEFREEIAEHKNEILHRANLDLEGMDSAYYDTTTAKKKFVNNVFQRAAFSSTYTFEQFLKFFGKHSANGEGRLYNYFHKLNQDALDEEQLYNEMNRNALDEKTKELFGKEKFMKLVGIDGKGMKEMDVDFTDYSNKETGKRTIHLKQGQMLYIYLVNKETDGEMKLRAMGITEEKVDEIEKNLDPRVKAMGEWLQDEYLPECQRRYQSTHTKYFGAPMKEIENYFPLAINNRARNVREDVNQDSDAMSRLAGTSTGAIITRRVNVIPLDIENVDAFEVAFNHLQEMEEWSAMQPFRQDINTLLSYTHFRNQVQNMSSVAYGSGKTLWDEFMQTAQIAAGTYKPKVKAGMMDSRIAAAMGGIAVAKISGRLWTAIKQSQSATVFLPECDFTRFVKNGVNPYGSWKWAMENIPDFRKRVENMTYGDVKLRQYLDELEKWHDWTKTISKIGMAPNILVDGITCAVGARSVYETEVNRLTKLGYPKEKAEEKAYYKAVAAYNKTQQSSGGMYLSPMQVDRTYVSAALSLFKNANYAYGRMQIEACRGLARTYDLWGGKHKTTLIESMTRQIMEEDGLDENTARAIAKATYSRTFRQSIGRLINFATLVPVSWALYKVLPYLLTGDDDDKKKEMIEEAVLKGFATSLSDNYVIPFASNILNAGLKVEDGKPTFDPEVFRYQNLYINPATSDLANIYSMIGNQKWYSVANKLGMLGVQSLIGFNPETVGALYQAFAEADYDNGNAAKEWKIGILKAISAPEESIRELYMDELGLKSGDIKKIPLAELEKRYAERQINRDNLLSQIGMDAETFNGYVEKYQKSFEKKIKDKMDKWDEYDKKKADEFFDTTSDPKLKDMIAKKRANDANAAADEQIAKEGLNQEKKGKEPSEVAYDAVKMSIDVAEDNAISTYNKVLNKRYAALNDEYNNQTDAMKYIFMSKHPNFKAYKDLESEYTTYGKKLKELKEKLVSADGYDAKQTILKQIRAERDKFYELQSKVR